MDIQVILELIKRALIPELTRFEERFKALESRQQEILSLVSNRQAQVELEVRDLRDRISRLEGAYEGMEDRILTKLENKSLKAAILRLLGRRK